MSEAWRLPNDASIRTILPYRQADLLIIRQECTIDHEASCYNPRGFFFKPRNHIEAGLGLRYMAPDLGLFFLNYETMFCTK